MDTSKEEAFVKEATVEEASTQEISPTPDASQNDQQATKPESLACEDENASDKESSSAKNNRNASSEQTSEKEDGDEDSQPLVEEDNQEDLVEGEEDNQEDLAEVEEETNKLFSDINYGTVLSYFDKFSVHLALRNLNVFKNFETSITNRKNLNRKFIEFHINLLKNLNSSKHVKRDKWEYYLAKYVNKFSKKDSAYLEKNGYLSCSTETRLAIIKNLLESQFDENSRLKQAVAEKYEPEALRSEPIGYDNTGLSYWYFMDPECAVRLFTAQVGDEKSWKIIAKTKSEIKELIDVLASDSNVVKLRSTDRYKKRMDLERQIKEEAALQKLKEEKEYLAKQEAVTEQMRELKTEESIEIKTEEVKKEAVCAVDKDLYDDELESDKKLDDIKVKKKEDESISEDIDVSCADESERKLTEETKTEKEAIKSEEIKEDQLKEDKELAEETKNTSKIDEEDVEIKAEKNEVNKAAKAPCKSDEEDVEIKEEKNEVDKVAKTPNKIDVDDYNEPIAYRRSSRSAVKKAQEIQQLQKQFEVEAKQKKLSPKKKPTTPVNKKPVKKVEVTYLDDFEDESEEESPEEESDSEDDVPLSSFSKKKKTQKKASGKKKSSKKTSETQESNSKAKKKLVIEEEDPDGPECIICLKSKPRTIAIICDSCNSSYHVTCLKPKLTEIPEDDWYCPTCHQDNLVRSLEEKLSELDQAVIDLEQRRIREKAEQAEKKAAALKETESISKNREVNSDQEANEVPKSEQNNFFCEDEPVGPRSCRVKKNITYTFEEYDRNINKAVGISDRSSRQIEPVEYIPRSTRRTRNSNICRYDFDDSYESEAMEEDNDERLNDSKHSNDSEFKVKVKKKKTSDYSDDEDEEDEEDEEDDIVDSDEEVEVKAVTKRKKRSKTCSDSDESFKVSKKRVQKKVSQKKKKKGGRKSYGGRRKRLNRYEDTEDEDLESSESDGFSDESSDEDEKIARYNNLFVEERRSTRARTCIAETYCEEDGESDVSEKAVETRKSKKKKKVSSDETFDENEDLEVSRKEKRKAAVIREPWLDDETESEAESDKGVKRRSTRVSKSVIKKPWSDDDDDGEKSESEDDNKSSESEESYNSEKEEKNECIDSKKEKTDSTAAEKKVAPEANNPIRSVDESTKTGDKAADTTPQVKEKMTADEVVKNLDKSISEYSSDESPSPASVPQTTISPRPVETKIETKPEISSSLPKQPESASPVAAKPQTLQTFNIPSTAQHPAQQPQLIYAQPVPAQFPNVIFPHQQPQPTTIQHMYFNQAVINNGMPIQNCFNPALFPQHGQSVYYDQMQFQQQMMYQGPSMGPPGSQPVMMQIHPQQPVMFNPSGMFPNQAMPSIQPGFMPVGQNVNGAVNGHQVQTNLFQPHLGI